jgi:NAD(P)-dependent dehydrogenase (short-subunit alcohol dehydrogenase family)
MTPPDRPLEGKVMMVTGANSGIGLETVRGLAKLGAHVVMACRNPRLCQGALEDIKRTTGSGSLEMMFADLSSQAEVRSLAEEFRAKHDRLDVLINNAAIVPKRRLETVDGIEWQLAVNHLAPFMLTLLLLDVLVASAPSRVITVSSEVHLRARIDFDDIQGERGYRGFKRYGTTKLANILFTMSLARRLRGTGVTSNTLTPGFKATCLARDANAFSRAMVRLLAGSPASGAVTPIYLASSEEVEGVNGAYFKNSAPGRVSDRAQNDADGERLWKLSEELTSISSSEIFQSIGTHSTNNP